jgi:flavodoxin
MGRCGVEERPNVVVVEPVVDVSALASVPHDAGGAQQAQRLRDLRLAGVDAFGDLVHAQFVGRGERSEDPEAGRVTEQPEQGSALLGRERFTRHLHICEYIRILPDPPRSSRRGPDVLESGVMKAALLVESLTGNTWNAAEMIGDKLRQERWTITGMSKVGQPDLSSVQRADIVLVGTWTHGLFVVGQAPYALGSIANLPTMRGKKAACFLTFALNAGKSVDRLTTAVGQTGASVVGGLEIKRNYLDEHTDLFVERLLDVVEPV